MKKLSISLAGLLVFACLAAVYVIFIMEPRSITPKTFGGSKYDSARDIVITADNKYIIAGMTTSYGIGFVDAYFLKLDPRGSRIWDNTFGGNNDDRIFSIINTAAGDFAAAGYSSSFGGGGNDMYLICGDKKGNLKFAKIYGGHGRDEAYSVVQADDGGFLLAGLTDSFSGTKKTQVYLVKTDADANLAWSKNFGGKLNDQASCIIRARDSGYIITGSTESYSNGMQDILLVKVDGRGNTLWVRNFGGKSSDTGNKVIQSNDTGYMLLGTESSMGKNNTDIYLIKTDAEGNCVWARAYGGPGMDQANTIIPSGDGGYVIGGTSESFSSGSTDIVLIKIDNNGNQVWEHNYGGKVDEYCGNIVRCGDKGFAVAGWTASFGAGDYDIYFFKVDKDGNF